MASIGIQQASGLPITPSADFNIAAIANRNALAQIRFFIS